MPAESSVKPGAYFDVDGTVFKSSVLEKIADVGQAHGLFEKDAFTEAKRTREKWQRHNNEGVYLAYLKMLVGSFVTQIADVSVSDFDKVVEEVNTTHQVRRFQFPLRLMDAVSSTHNIVIISGSPHRAVEAFVCDLPIDIVFGSEFVVKEDTFTGEARSVGDKAALRNRLISAGIVSAEEDLAIGDTMSDAPLLGAVTLPIAFNPSATLSDYSEAFGWHKVLEVKDNITVLQPVENGYVVGSSYDLLSTARSLAK